jgi:predicted nuclease of predicted toxin-antitoxin system
LILWVDAQLSPALCPWIESALSVTAVAVRDLGLRDATDAEIFRAARSQSAVVMSKDRDFRDLVLQHGPPPQVLWLTCGNTSNAALTGLLAQALPEALRHLEAGAPLVEIGDRRLP